MHLQARNKFGSWIAKPGARRKIEKRIIFILLLLKIDFVHRCVCSLPTVDLRHEMSFFMHPVIYNKIHMFFSIFITALIIEGNASISIDHENLRQDRLHANNLALGNTLLPEYY